MNKIIYLKINNERKKIDKIDCQIISLLKKRFKIAKNIKKLKLKNKICLKDKLREQKILNKIIKFNKNFIPKKNLINIYKQIFKMLQN